MNLWTGKWRYRRRMRWELMRSVDLWQNVDYLQCLDKEILMYKYKGDIHTIYSPNELIWRGKSKGIIDGKMTEQEAKAWATIML